MTLCTRVTLAAGGAVLLAALAVSVTVYVVVRGNLLTQVDESLEHQRATEQGFPHDLSTVQSVPLVQDLYLQVVDRDGGVVTTFDERPLPVTADVVAVARGEREDAFFDAEVGGTAVRVYARAAGQGTAVELGRSLDEVEQALRQLVVTLLAISVAAVGLAAVIGRLVAATVLAPVRRVATAAETVARTGELSHHIAVPGGDDLGRLADSFNAMLDALSESLAQQRRLVADASHELRTPLATVRMNVETLTRADELEPEDRAMLIGDTVAQIEELTRLVGDLVELARSEGEEEAFSAIALDELTREVAAAAERSYPALAFRLDVVPSRIRGAPGRVARAVSNLVDNAAKWGPPGSEVDIAVRDGRVMVRDHGPGVDAADLPHIFDRFYRSPAARTMPGSGLGLAIVKQVADSHGGTVSAAAAPGGGAQFVLQFPIWRTDLDHAEHTDHAEIGRLEVPS